MAPGASSAKRGVREARSTAEVAIARTGDGVTFFVTFRSWFFLAPRRRARRSNGHYSRVMYRPALVRHSYALVRSWIRRDGGRGEMLDERQLQRSTGSSRTEIREVLGQLVEEGLVERRPRAGTRVDTGSTELAIDLPIAYSAAPLQRYGQLPLHEGEVSASAALSALFGAPEEATFLVTDSMIELDGVPLALRTSYWRGSETRRPSPAGTPGADMASLFRETFGVPLASCEARVEAVLATERFAQQLQVDRDEPLLLREAVLRGEDGVVHEVNFSYYAGRRVALQMRTDYLH